MPKLTALPRTAALDAGAAPWDNVATLPTLLEGGRYDLFRWLPNEVREAFMQAAKPRFVQEGQIIYQQGDIANEMYRIVSGAVRLTSMQIDGRELMYTLFVARDTFGYSSLIDRHGLPHTAEAQTPVHLQVLSRDAFMGLRRKYEAFNEALMQTLCIHVRGLSTSVSDAVLEDLPQRLARRLLEIARQAEDNAATIPLSQTELALLMGVSRQTVHKFLKMFEDEGLVRQSYGAVVLPDLRALKIRADIAP